jgi:plastocyanin
MSSNRSFRVAAVAIAASLLWFATGAKAADAAPANGPRVLIKDFMFEPTTLTVTAGSVVTWSNGDDEPHSVTSDTGLFRSGAMDTNESFSYKFDKPGTYRFVCSIHPKMVGTIVVK